MRQLSFDTRMKDRIGSCLLSSLLLSVDLCEILLRELEHHGGEQQHADEVGDCHETVEGISDVPSEAQIDGGTDDADQREDHLIGSIDPKITRCSIIGRFLLPSEST